MLVREHGHDLNTDELIGIAGLLPPAGHETTSNRPRRLGHGVHHCLGAPPARMEMRIASPAPLRRFPDLTLAAGVVHYSVVPYSGTRYHRVPEVTEEDPRWTT
ncbi:hypothetical protein ACFV1N_44030 [Streptosporangium canum]|uniref:hypothetical protein n=1 Tax=Streptosporangium canum TaxID=324952 RepID=UPI00367A8A43